MPIGFRMVATAVLALALAGCREDQDITALTDLANKTARNAESEPVTPPASMPVPPEKRMAHDGRKLEIPDRAGSIEWVHKPGEPVARLYFSDAQSHPLGSVSGAVMWLAASTAPAEVALQPCGPTEPGCWQARSPQLADGVPRGLVRFAIGGERYRVALATREIEPASASQPAASHGLPAQHREGLK